jgi:sulfate transport system permease protein
MNDPKPALLITPVAPTGLQEPAWLRWLLTGLAVLFLSIFVIFPLLVVFYNAFQDGVETYWRALQEPDLLASLRLTLFTILIAVPANTVFGLCAAWALTKFRFRGKTLLTTLINVPFTVSPVISGVIFILLLGSNSILGAWLTAHGYPIIFAVPGIVLATLFVTLPFVAQELITLMQSQGVEEEEAAVMLGANGWQTFLHVTLPNIRWGLLYGIILCTTRALGEFGAVSVVSGHIRGKTITLPLEVEILYNEYNFIAAFSAASLLTLTSLGTLVFKKLVEWQSRKTEKELNLFVERKGMPAHEH